MTEKVELPAFLLEHNPWEGEINPIWLATVFIVHRNIAKYNFPPKMNEGQLQQTLGILKNALINNKELLKPLFFNAEEISPLDKEFLFEHFLCQGGFQNTLNGQGFVIDSSARFLAMLNIDDHLQLQLIDCKAEMDTAWKNLANIETAISNSLGYAFSERFGYLTSDPSLAGTGLTVLVYLHLPALLHTKKLEDILLKQKDEDVEAFSMEGELDGHVGDIVVLRNQYTLGQTEENIMQSLQSSAMKLVLAEKTTRYSLQQEKNADIKDQISRAYGLLIHSYQLQTKEALDALSLIKLGLDLGWVSGTTDAKINEIFFKCRRGHLTTAFKDKKMDSQELPHQRAELLHNLFKDVQLKLDA